MTAAFVFTDRTTSRRVQFIGWTVIALVIFTIFEIGQLFVPSRVPDATDIAIGLAGVMAGMKVGFWITES